MDEIIYLELDEEITSVIDKIKNAENSSIGLVVPRNATLLQSVVNLRLIGKEAKNLGKEIAIITSDKIGRNLATQVGLPVYNSIRDERPILKNSQINEIDRDEVIEIKPTPVPSIQPEKPVPNGEKLHIHHFQDDRPIVRWKPTQNTASNPVEVKNKKEEIVSKPIIVDREKERRMDRKAKKIVWPIVGILVVLLGFAAFLLLPKSNVQVFVKSDDLDKTLPIVFSSSVTTPDLTQNYFPGSLVAVSKEESQKFPTTGKKNSGGKATASATFYNGLDSLAHRYLAGTKLIASGKTFVTKTDITIPAATLQNMLPVPGTVTVQIEAENAGEDYNIKAQKFVIVGIPANQQKGIYAQTTTDAKGGFTKVLQVVSKEDYENAQKLLLDSLTSGLDQDLKAKTVGLSIIDKSQVVSEPEVTSSAAVDAEATDFEIKVKLTKQVMAYNYNKFFTFLTAALEQQVPAGKMVAIPSADAISFTIDKQSYDKGELETSVKVVAKIATKIDPDQIKTGVLGKTNGKAISFISSQPGVERVNISFNPNWLKRVSDLSRNVEVKINYVTE